MRLRPLRSVLAFGWCFIGAFALVAVTKAGQPEIRFGGPAEPAQPSPSAEPVVPAQLLQPLPDGDPAPRPDALLGSGVTPQARMIPTQLPRPGVAAPSFTRPLVDPQVTSQTRQSLGFYGGYSARTTLSQMPRRTPIRSAPALPMQRQLKPFNTVYRDPTVSPYLNLYRSEEDNEAAPNYFAFVRPQLEQLEANRVQQREIQQLRGQLQSMSPTVVSPGYQSSGMPGTGTPARYMDTAQFYGGWRR
jgi:hypothetical protein